MTRLRTRAQCAWTTRIPADELDEDGYQRPGAAAGAPAVLPPAAFFWLRPDFKTFSKVDDKWGFFLLDVDTTALWNQKNWHAYGYTAEVAQ